MIAPTPPKDWLKTIRNFYIGNSQNHPSVQNQTTPYTTRPMVALFILSHDPEDHGEQQNHFILNPCFTVQTKTMYRIGFSLYVCTDCIHSIIYVLSPVLTNLQTQRGHINIIQEEIPRIIQKIEFWCHRCDKALFSWYTPKHCPFIHTS